MRTKRSVHLPELYALSFGVIALMLLFLAACGGMEPVDESLDEIESEHYAFKHGPPPGPPPYDYFLTSYKDFTTPACGGKTIDGTWYYATGAWSFGCHARLKLEANGKCVVVAVVDNGPAGWVETKAKNKCGGTGYIIDASPLVSKHLFGTTSAGWSDCYKLKVTPMPKGTPSGPTSCGGGSPPSSPPPPPPPPPPMPKPQPPAGDFIGQGCHNGGQCSSGACLTDQFGYADGMCSQPCQRLCPDSPVHPVTFCIELGTPQHHGGWCFSRCDYVKRGPSGCRPGYRCAKLPRHGEPWVKRNTCIPDSWKTDTISAEVPDAEGDQPNPEVLRGGEGAGGEVGVGGCSMGPAPKRARGLPALLLLTLMALGLRRRAS
jgi:hypothetical protein